MTRGFAFGSAIVILRNKGVVKVYLELPGHAEKKPDVLSKYHAAIDPVSSSPQNVSGVYNSLSVLVTQ